MTHHHTHAPVEPGQQHGEPHAHQHGDDAGLAALLDLDRSVLAVSWAQVDALVAAAAPATVRTVVDLGAGTGTASVALAGLFPAAEVVAVDTDPALPARLATRTSDPRVRAVVADLDAGWPDLGRVDVVWASMSLHHLGDPDRTLREVFEAVARGGLLVAVEFDEPVRVLAAGTAGDVEERAMRALRGVHEREVPELGSDWAARFAAAGFAVEGEHAVPIDVRPPLPDGAARYAQLWLGRMAAGIDRLDPADVATLTRLGTDAGVAAAVARDEVHLHGVRTVTLARRP